MTAMPLHLPDKLHVPMDKLHLDKLPLDRLPFTERRTSRLRRKRNLLLAVPLLGGLVAAVAYWRRTREQVLGDSRHDTDVRQQALHRVGIPNNEEPKHEQASAPSSTASGQVPSQHRSA